MDGRWLPLRPSLCTSEHCEPHEIKLLLERRFTLLTRRLPLSPSPSLPLHPLSSRGRSDNVMGEKKKTPKHNTPCLKKAPVVRLDILCLFVVNLYLLVVILLTFFWLFCVSVAVLYCFVAFICQFVSFAVILCFFVVVLCLFVVLRLTGGRFVPLCSRFVPPSDHFVPRCGHLIDWSNKKCYQWLDNEVLSCCPFPCTQSAHALCLRPRLPLFPSSHLFRSSSRGVLSHTLSKQRKRTRKESAPILWDLINSIYSYCLDSLKVLGSAFSGSISHNIVREAMVMHEDAGTQFIPEQVLSVR